VVLIMQRCRTAATAAKLTTMAYGRPFSVWMETKLENRVVIHIDGELDIATAPQLQEAIGVSLDGGVRHLIIDLTRTTFVDSTALGVIVGGVKRARSMEGSLDIVTSGGQVRRTFEITGLLHVVDEYETVEEALSGLDSEPSAEV
jgi:anti-sigma B factor antagonist